MILLVDQLYSRQIFDNHPYTHLRALPERPENMLTIMGPSKTESLSGFRLGTAFGTSWIIDRMENSRPSSPCGHRDTANMCSSAGSVSRKDG